MKNPNKDVLMTEEGFALRFHPRPVKNFRLDIPEETAASLEKVAETRDMSIDGLLKFYIGQGLRQDLAHSFTEHILDKTKEVLREHIDSEETVSSILKEIQVWASVTCPSSM